MHRSKYYILIKVRSFRSGPSANYRPYNSGVRPRVDSVFEINDARSRRAEELGAQTPVARASRKYTSRTLASPDARNIIVIHSFKDLITCIADELEPAVVTFLRARVIVNLGRVNDASARVAPRRIVGYFRASVCVYVRVRACVCVCACVFCSCW